MDSKYSEAGMVIDLVAIVSGAIWLFSDTAASNVVFMVVLIVSGIIFGFRLLCRWLETL